MDNNPNNNVEQTSTEINDSTTQIVSNVEELEIPQDNSELEKTTNIEITSQPKKKKNNKGLIVVLVLIILGLGGYITYDKVLKDKLFTKEENTTKEEVKNNNVEKTDNKKEYKIQINNKYDHYVKKEHTTILNEKELNVVNVYYYNDSSNDSEDYDLFMETFVNGERAIDIYQVTYYNNKNEVINKIDKIENEFKLSKIKDISISKEYLVIDRISEGYSCSGKTYFIVDENANKITDIIYEDGCGTSSIIFNSESEAKSSVISEAIQEIDGKYRAFQKKSAYILGNAIYYVVPYDCEDIEYHKSVIENGKIKDTKIKTYTGKMANIAGSC